MHCLVMDGVKQVKVAVEWNGIFPSLESDRQDKKTLNFL